MTGYADTGSLIVDYAADRNVRKGVTEVSIESDGIDVFVVYNGTRVAKRADHRSHNSGSLAMFATIRRASALVSSFGSSKKTQANA